MELNKTTFKIIVNAAYERGRIAGYEAHKVETRPEIEVDDKLKIQKVKLNGISYYYANIMYNILNENGYI